MHKMKYIARSEAQRAYQFVDRIVGRVGMGQREMKIFMAGCDVCDSECDMVIDPESLRVRRGYNYIHYGRRPTAEDFFFFCWAQWTFCYNFRHTYYSYTLREQLNFIVQFVSPT